MHRHQDTIIASQRPARQRGNLRAWVMLFIVVAIVLWWIWVWRGDTPPTVPAQPRAVVARGSLAEEERNNIDVFKTASVSTVHITTLELARGFPGLDVTQVPRGTGSGFIWDERGHVVTNFHVIQGGSGARVTLYDQSTWRAALVGAFPDRDLAVLRIDAPKEKMKPIAIGSSKDLLVGQRVYAIGNPFGLDQTLTTGIISALNREIESMTKRAIHGVIQTDAAINPGNSGGPLLDSAGRLIGVNTAIFSPSGAFAGIGFAIPVDEVNRIVPRLIRDGKFIRPALGIQAAPPQFSEVLGIKQGVAVLGVLPNSPAQAAGLRPFQRGPAGEIIAGDVITAIDGTEVENAESLLDLLERHQPGETVKVTVLRDGKSIDIPVTLGISG
ncbi:MAG TPA: trypsin-like peptidase domain-containing protein [Burkholderiales bacterium]|jgi:S1-C subfamily serine protease|nr:trypsin-like peptidase domain-containing protein [Burkholderiales bacterium]